MQVWWPSLFCEDLVHYDNHVWLQLNYSANHQGVLRKCAQSILSAKLDLNMIMLMLIWFNLEKCANTSIESIESLPFHWHWCFLRVVHLKSLRPLSVDLLLFMFSYSIDSRMQTSHHPASETCKSLGFGGSLNFFSLRHTTAVLRREMTSAV